MRFIVLATVVCAAVLWHPGTAFSQAASGTQDPVFSGPQADEPLPAFPALLILREDVGKPVDIAAKEEATPHQLLIVVHQITRPSVAYARTLGQYAVSRKNDGLDTSMAFLGEDATEMTQRVRRAKRALPEGVTIGVSPDGAEGPGSYGLNRNVTLTVMLAKDGTVVFNQALIDPSIPVELPKVLQAICDVCGGEAPSVETLLKGRPGMRGMNRRANPRGEREAGDESEQQPEGFQFVEPLLRQLIQKDAAPDRVDGIADKIDQLLAKYPEAKTRVEGIAKRVYKTYGTERAQFHLRRWAGVED